ncbi:MAG: helix-turn-helix domain-containing protein [Cellulomonas sp.]
MAGATPPASELGPAIKARRKKANLTQATLAKLAGYAGKSAVTISRIENGHMAPSPTALTGIATAFGVTVEQLKKEAEALSPTGLAELSQATARGASHFARLALMGEQGEQNHLRKQAIAEEVEYRGRITDEVTTKLGDAQARAVEDLLVPYFEQAGRISGVELPARASASGPNAELEPVKARIAAEREQIQGVLLNAVSSAALGAGVGAAAGIGVAAAAYSMTAAFAAASTGTAIAALSGAAATSATLAALGGGSLAAGGLGVAGGTMLLTGIVAGPVLIAAGAVLAYKGRQLRRQAEADSERLTVAELALADSKVTLDRIWSWARTETGVLLAATARGSEEVRRLQTALAELSDGQVQWDSTSATFQKRFANLTSVVVTVLSIAALPILTAASESGADEATDTAIEWIDKVLLDAAKEFDVSTAA